jgi:hypothetical protein
MLLLMTPSSGGHAVAIEVFGPDQVVELLPLYFCVARTEAQTAAGGAMYEALM